MSGSSGALEEFFVALGLSADSAAFGAAQLMVDGLEKGLELLVEVAGEAIDKFAESIVQTAEYAHGVEHAAEMTGRSTDSIQELAYVSTLAGVAGDTLQNGFVHLAKSMNAVREGSLETSMAFGRLGVRALDNHGKMRDQEVVFSELADAIAKLPAGAERSAAAVAIFGKSGAELVPILAKGSEEIRKQREEAEALGAVMSGEAVESGADFAKNLDRLKLAGQGVIHEFAEPLIKALNPLIDDFITWVKVNRQLISTKVQDFAKVLVKGVEALAAVVGFVVDNFDKFAAIAKVVALVLGSVLIVALGANALAILELITWYVALSVQAVAAAVASAAAWLFAAAPMIAIVALVALMIAGFEDLFVFLRGGRSVIGRILNSYSDKIFAFWEVLKAIVLPWWFTALFGPDAVDKVALKIGDAVMATKKPPATGGALASYDPGDFVSGGAVSPAAAAQLQSGGQSASYDPGAPAATSSVQVQAPVTINVTTSPNQSNEDIGVAAAKHVAEHVDARIRDAASIKK